jgi:dipeptidyl aminopeptidase/acylaminoacyl peptidase
VEQTNHFQRLRSAGSGKSGEVPRIVTAAGLPPKRGSRGAWAWLAPEGNGSRVTASLAADGSKPITCAAPECAGPFLSSFWWSADNERVIFWAYDRRNGFDPVLYAWSPSTQRITMVVASSSQRFRDCAMSGDRLLCVRETAERPGHVAAIDTRSGKITLLADVNPELANIRFGRIERIEWEVPSTVPDANYAPRATGYILYPPDFDPSRKYPVFIAPYRDGGFPRGDTGNEHPLFAYAASGIVVLNTNFPLPVMQAGMSGTDFMKLLYSGELDFPHLTTLMKSTLRALDLVAQRGFLDERRVGIGGVSHGSFVPLYMLQKEDRLAAVSIAGGHWSPMQYYSSAASTMGRPRAMEWYPAPFGDGLSWWNRIDIAQHVDRIEAPILFNFADSELFTGLTLMRHM